MNNILSPKNCRLIEVEEADSVSDFWELPLISYHTIRQSQNYTPQTKRGEEIKESLLNETILAYFIQNSDSKEASALADYYTSLTTEQRQTISKDIQRRGELRGI